MPHEVIDHVHHKAWQENTSTGLSILNHWREQILDEPVHPDNMPNNANDDDTTDDDSSYHPDEDVGSLTSMNELETESIAPIQAAPNEPEPIGEEVVNDNLQIKGDYDNETIIAEPKVTHAADDDLFVPVELPANPVITPCLSWAMKNLEIDGATPPPPPPLGACTQRGKVLSTVVNMHVEQDGLLQALVGVVMTQCHVQKGLKVFGEAGADGIRKELQQLHNLVLLRAGTAPMVNHSISTLARLSQHLPPFSRGQSSNL